MEGIWRDLEARASPPYFQCWGWVENWRAALPRDLVPSLWVLQEEGGPRGAFFLGRRRVTRHRLIRSRAVFLNTTGVEGFDELTVEHNGVLLAPGAPLSLADLLDGLPHDWDEFFLPSLSRATFPGSALDEGLRRHVVRIDREVPSPYVDLARVRAAGGYLPLLGSSTRAQLRQTQRALPGASLDVAGSVAEALDVYREMVALHTRTWSERGLPGAFGDPWFDAFHRRLVENRFGHGEIQLLRVRSAGTTVGCLYNLVSGGRVLFYQSGLASFENPRIKPGYLCHHEAVLHNAALGHATYDFLGGTSRYKSSLATDTAPLVSARVQRRLARFALEDRLRRWKRAARSGG